MITVPFEMKHLEEIDLSQVNRVGLNVLCQERHYFIVGKTVIDNGEILGLGLISLYGKFALAHLMLTPKIKRMPLFMVKEIKAFLKEAVDEKLIVLAAAYGKVEKRFLEFLGFKPTGTFVNNGLQVTRYIYGSN